MHGALAFVTALTLPIVAAALPAAPAPADEVLVDSARIEALVEPMFDAFTARTGSGVRSFSASEAELFERLRAEGPGTPAGVLMTVDVGTRWLAAQAGLQGFRSAAIENPAHLRARDRHGYPPNPAVTPQARLPGRGTFRADAVDVAAAGERQAAAVGLMDRDGWE
jgi:iron(III) transport system substrate-binding protein